MNATQDLTESVKKMLAAVQYLCGTNFHSFWLYGSLVLDDFRPGWSDIDFLALTNSPLTPVQAEQLLGLRQQLSEQEPPVPYARSFEGIFVSISEYLTRQYTRLVYWGTSGQRITDRYPEDPFAQFELARYGKCIFGSPNRQILTEPDPAALTEAVRHHYLSIRRCAGQTDESLYSCGWLLDIARCLYTLRHFDVIGKTQAGQWALENHLFPDEEPLRKALMIRKNPAAYKDRSDIREWLRSLGQTVRQYADVLEKALQNAG